MGSSGDYLGMGACDSPPNKALGNNTAADELHWGGLLSWRRSVGLYSGVEAKFWRDQVAAIIDSIKTRALGDRME